MISLGGRLQRWPAGTVAAASSRGSARARLLGGASSLAIPAASMVLALGVSLSSGASAQTVIGNHATTYNLNPANNPFLINSGTTVSDPANDAIDGGANPAQWALTNNGTVTGNTNGIKLQTQGTITNAGSITGTNNFGVYLQAGGSVTNQAAGTISGAVDGVFVNNFPGTVTNAGTITGTNNYGVYLKAGGSVTNQAGAHISGGANGILVSNATGTVTNAGTIATAPDGVGVNLAAGGSVTNAGTITAAGVIGVGVLLSAGGSVTNQAGGTINAGGLGVYLVGGGSVTNQAGGQISGFNGVVVGNATGTVTNAGTITGTNKFGVYFKAGGSVTNQAGGTISGQFGGVLVSGGVGTVSNAGAITGVTRYGVYLKAGGSLTNQAEGTISGQRGGVLVSSASGTVTNAGAITGATRYGVYLNAGGSVTNQARGTITGSTHGVEIAGGGTVTNAGTITGVNLDGVYLKADGSVTNQAGGTISGAFNGVFSNGGPSTVTNAGTITGANYNGVSFLLAGSVTNQAGGLIKGLTNGIYIGVAGTVTNAGTVTGANNNGVFLADGGTVTNQAGGTISGARYGVYVTNSQGTVTNAGTVTGGTDSVFFGGTGANKLILQTGSVLNGTAVGSTAGGATNALILQGTGTANNIFLNFNTLDVTASGTWTLNNSSAIGATTIDSGTLAIGDAGHLGATLTSPVAVKAGGTLAGDGTVIGAVTINSGGAVQGGLPGGFGTLNISGNLTFNSGGILATTITPQAASLVNVTGPATLAGGTVQVTAGTFFTHSQTFTILTATAPISTTFSSVSMTTALASNPRLSYDAHDVFLTVDAGSFAAVLPPSASVNQVNVAKAIDAGLAAGGTLPAGFLALGNLPLTNLPGALTQLSGETATGSQQTTFQAMTQFLGTLLDPFIGGRDGGPAGSGATPFAEEFDSVSGYAADASKRARSQRDAYAMFTKAPPAPFDARWSVWAAGFGGSQSTDGNATLGSNTATSRLGAVAVGADYRFSPYTIAGFALAGGGTNFSVTNGGTGRSDLFQAGAFVRHNVGPAYIAAALAYGWQDITTDRTVTVAGNDQLRARFNANAWSGRVEGGYRFVAPWVGGIGITPYAAGQFTTFDLPAYAEQAIVGSNQFALAYGAKSVTDTRSELGIRTDKSWAMQSAILTLRGRLAWAHDFNPDRNIAATFQTLPGASFVVGGAAQAHDSALTTASAEIKWLNGWSAAATFEGEFSSVTRSYAGKGVVRYTW